jgi:hypothetical protein
MLPDRLSLGKRLNDQGRGGRSPCAWRREVRAIVGEDDGDFVRHSFDEIVQEMACGTSFTFAMKLDEGELAGPIDGEEQTEPTLRDLNLGKVDMNVANRVTLEPGLRRLLDVDLGQPSHPWTLGRH